MKKILLILLVFISLVGCGPRISIDDNTQEASNGDKAASYGSGATVIVVNSCQYVLYVGNNSGDVAMVHAGNCNNPIHKP